MVDQSLYLPKERSSVTNAVQVQWPGWPFFWPWGSECEVRWCLKLSSYATCLDSIVKGCKLSWRRENWTGTILYRRCKNVRTSNAISTSEDQWALPIGYDNTIHSLSAVWESLSFVLGRSCKPAALQPDFWWSQMTFFTEKEKDKG